MASTRDNGKYKQTSVRWHVDFWEAVGIEAKKRRTSVQAMVTEAVSEKYGIPIPEVCEGPEPESEPAQQVAS